MPAGFDVLIPIALLASSVAITIWVLLMPAAVITVSYGPSSPDHVADRHQDLSLIARSAPWGMAAPLREAGPKLDRDQLRCSCCHRLIRLNVLVLLDSLLLGQIEPEEGFEPSTFRLRVGCSASIWMAPDGSSLLTLDASRLQTDTDRSSG
jgi:hypothetical protein